MKLSNPTACLEELEGCAWGDANADNDTNLVTRCHALRRKPLGQFAVEDLRIMIGQNIGSLHLMPYALEVLRADSLAEGDFYPGDLLSSAISLPDEFWREHQDLEQDVRSIAARALDMLRGSREGMFADPSFIKIIQRFLERPAIGSGRLSPTSGKHAE